MCQRSWPANIRTVLPGCCFCDCKVTKDHSELFSRAVAGVGVGPRGREVVHKSKQIHLHPAPAHCPRASHEVESATEYPNRSHQSLPKRLHMKASWKKLVHAVLGC
jgi:hypothetical protein